MVNKSRVNNHVLRVCINKSVNLVWRGLKLLRNHLPHNYKPQLGVFEQHPPEKLSKYVEGSTTTYAFDQSFSIVTPSYQQGQFIERTISSVVKQVGKNTEYFVQDGGSTDNTVQILEKYANSITGWETKADLGQANALNLGFAKTSGHIMSYINSDDILLPNTLEIVDKYFYENPRVDVVYGNRLVIDDLDRVIGEWILPGHDEDLLSYADYIPQETLFWRRRIWDAIGGQFDEGFKFAMDWDLILRFRSVGARFLHIPRFLGAFRYHSLQKTDSLISTIGQEEMDLLRERELGYVPTSQQMLRKVLPFMIKHVLTTRRIRKNAVC